MDQIRYLSLYVGFIIHVPYKLHRLSVIGQTEPDVFRRDCFRAESWPAYDKIYPVCVFCSHHSIYIYPSVLVDRIVDYPLA